MTTEVHTPEELELQRLEEAVDKTEGDGLRARWESGRCMLRMRRQHRRSTSIRGDAA